MWFEPVTTPDVNGHIPTVYPVGFTEPPGFSQSGLTNKQNYVLNDHTYCCQLVKEPGVCDLGEPSLQYADECLEWHRKRIGQRQEDAVRLGVPFHITEFGACLTEEACTQEISQVTSLADEYLVGWAYWQFKYFEDLTTSAGTGNEGFYNSDSSLQTWKVKALARSYLQYT